MNILKLNLNDHIKNNYIYLPREFIEDNHLEGLEIIKLKKINSDDILFFGWIGGISSKEGVIEISSLIAKNLRLFTGDNFKISNESKSIENSSINVLDSVELVPLTNHDYILVEKNSNFFEENLLNELIVVYDDLIFPFIFFDNKVALLKVKLEEKGKGFILSQDCEVKVAYVAPLPESDGEIITNKSKTISEKFIKFNYKIDRPFDILKNSIYLKVTRKFLIEKFKLDENIEKNFKNYICNISLDKNTIYNHNLIFTRLSDKSTISNFYSNIMNNKSISKDEFNYIIINKYLNKFPYKYNIWINLVIDDLESNIETTDYIQLEQYVKINTILYDNDKVDISLCEIDSDALFNDKSYFDFISNYLIVEYYSHSIQAEENIRNNLLNLIEYKSDNPIIINYDFMYIYTDDNSSNTQLIKFIFENKTLKDYLEILSRLKIHTNKLIKDDPYVEPFIYLNKNFVKLFEHLRLKKNDELGIIYNYNLSNKMYRHIFPSTEIVEIDFFNQVNKEIIQNDINKHYLIETIQKFYKNQTLKSVSVFTFPKEYFVKSFLSTLYKQILSSGNNLLYCYLNLNLFNLNSNNDLVIFEDYLKKLLKFYMDKKEKTIFIFEGLERFKNSDTSQQQNNLLITEIKNLLSYRFTKFINKCNKLNKKSTINLFYIMFIISGVAIESIPIDYFIKNTTFDIFKIKTISKEFITKILPKFFEIIRTSNNKNLELCSEHCQNFVLEDFLRIHSKLPSIQNSDELLNFLSNYIPISISDEKVLKFANDFTSVGGMETIKEEIHDTITLSLKSSEIFNNQLPIKMSSGILLIGPPGCGKTFIASALQKEFKINFYSIKGPEILNKYIGASEAAIREVFENAKKTIPCVIFFDEFDSLVPKRGLGSIGVTDRV